jgi:hypothetical protein
MIPFNVKLDGHRVGITFESLVWFFIVTAAATAVGTAVYAKWISPLMNPPAPLPPTTPPQQ